MTTILIKKKDTAGAPAAGDLTNAAGGAEIAVNTATKRIYSKDSGGNIIEMGTYPSTMAVQGNLSATGTLAITGATNLNGAVTLGDAAADNVTVTGTITSNLIFTDNTYDIGASGATRPRNLYLSGNANVVGVVQFSTDASQAAGSIAKNATYGMTLYGITGSSYDLSLLNKDGNIALGINTGTTTVNMPGSLTVAGGVTLSGGVANTIPYLNSSKVVTSSNTALTWTGQVMGVATTPNAWGSNWNGLQIANGTSYARPGGNASHLINNAYHDNTNYRYIGNAAAAQIILGDGNITMSTAATGSIGNVATFSTGLYIDQLGKGVGLFGTGATIPSGMTGMLALGDNDSGIAFAGDGDLRTYVNGVNTITYNSGQTVFNQYAGFGRNPSYIVDIAGNSRIMGATAFNDNILRMSLPSGTTGNYNQILFRDQGDTNTTASLTAYGSAYGSGLNNAVRIGNANGAVYLGQAGGWGLNTTPSTDWSTSYFMQADQGSFVGSADATRILQNAYFSGALGGGAARLNATYAPTQYLQNGGYHTFYTAGTGAAGSAISWTYQGAFNPNGILSLATTALNWDGSAARAFEASASSGLRGSLYQTASGVLGVVNNYYYNGGDKRGGSGYATRYYQYAGEHFFQVAASGAADSGISWTTGLTVNRTGTLLATGDAATDGNIQGFQTGGGFVERDYQMNSGSSRTIVVAGSYNYKFEFTVLAIGNSASSQIGEGRWVAGRRDYSGSNHIYNSGNLVGSCVSFSTSQSTVGAQCTYTITITNNQDGANNHWVIKVRLIGSDSFSIS